MFIYHVDEIESLLIKHGDNFSCPSVTFKEIIVRIFSTCNRHEQTQLTLI
jgi:hypothetical protein